MPGYIISLSGNTLTISRSDASDQVFSVELSKDVASDSQILNTELFSEALGQLILDSFGEKAEKLSFNFLVEPENVHLSFLTTTQKEKDEQALLHEASKKLAATALTLDDVYFSYQKIAPFVYQFVAIKKEILGKYLEVSNTLGFELRSVIPWVSVLPKSVVHDGTPSIFLVNNGFSKFMILTELGGVYYIGDLENKEQKIEGLVKELSVYERKNPINTVYTLNLANLDLGKEFEVHELEFANIHHLVVENIDFDVFGKQINLLNLFPVPAPVKNNTLIYVGSAVAIALFVGGFVLLKPFEKLGGNAEIAGDHDEVVEAVEATPAEVVQNTVEPLPDTEQNNENTLAIEPELELNRAVPKIRVENGTNIGGLAGRTRDFLISLGYDDELGVGDSVKSDVTLTTIEISSEFDAAGYTALIVEDLKGFYTDIEVHTLPETNADYDVLVTAGSNLKE